MNSSNLCLIFLKEKKVHLSDKALNIVRFVLIRKRHKI